MAQVRPLLPPPLFNAPSAAHAEAPGTSADHAAAAAHAAQQPSHGAQRAAGQAATPIAMQEMQASPQRASLTTHAVGSLVSDLHASCRGQKY